MHFSGNQTVQGPNDSFSTNCSKGFKRIQTMDKGLIKRNDRSFKKKSLSFINKYKFKFNFYNKV